MLGLRLERILDKKVFWVKVEKLAAVCKFVLLRILVAFAIQVEYFWLCLIAVDRTFCQLEVLQVHGQEGTVRPSKLITQSNCAWLSSQHFQKLVFVASEAGVKPNLFLGFFRVGRVVVDPFRIGFFLEQQFRPSALATCLEVVIIKSAIGREKFLLLEVKLLYHVYVG